MSRVRIEVVVAPDGSVTATTHNTRGTDCLPYIQVLEDLLDATTVDSAYTEDWSTTHSTPVADPAVARDYDR